MRVAQHRVRPLLLTTVVSVSLACGGPAATDTTPNPATPAGPGEAPTAPGNPAAPPGPAVDAPAAVVDGPVATLRTGNFPPASMDALTGTIVHNLSGDDDYYEIELPFATGDGRAARHATIDGQDGALVLTQTDGERVRLWMRRSIPSKMLSTTFSGTVWFEGYEAGEPRWYAAPFSATGTPSKDTGLPQRFADAMATQLREPADGTRSPFHHFAAGRIHAALGSGAAVPATTVAAARARETSSDLSQLMYTTTAATSLQEALQFEKGLGITAAPGKRNIAVSTVAGPALADHPFEAMRAGLKTTTPASEEPLAAAVPADFWYVRFSDIRDMLRVLDEASTWITPVAHAMEERPLTRDLAERYQRELGLGRSGLAKSLGHTAVSRLAITGSDPYLRDGSDVTFVFEVASQVVFDAELGKHLTKWQTDIPGIARTEVLHGAHTIVIHGDPDGLVRQHRSQVGNLAVVSNSEAACRRVLDAIDGKTAKLVDEPDLRYMLARDAGTHDAFAFVGDRFVASVVGPAQKIQQARRMQAAAELATPGYAALLYGWLEGRAPTSLDEMKKSGVLRAAELTHGDGEAITFTPGTAARSSWGRADALRPRIDLPPVTMVTEAEKLAYEQFAREYQDYWRQFIDPIAVRINLEGDTASIDVRVLPLIAGTNYRDVENVVGTQRVNVPAIDDGLHAVWAVGKDTELRRDLDRMSTSLSGKADLGIGWLGEWVMLGTLDRAALTDALAALDDEVQVPLPAAVRDAADETTIITALGKLPVFAAADIDNPAGLVAALAALRVVSNEVAPGSITWENIATHHEVPIVRVGVAKSANDDMARYADALAVFYAQVGGAIVFTLQRSTLEALIDRFSDAERRPSAVDDGGAQFVVEGHVRRGGGGWTALVWALQGQAQIGQAAARQYAEALLRGDPTLASDPARFHALGLAYFGGVPVTPEGRADYSMREDGVFDPVHGTQISPQYPALPVADDTPIAALMARLSSLRATVAFDDEPTSATPPVRSLHTRFELTLGATTAESP